MTLIVDFDEDSASPKRGDLIHTNVGDRRERTCMVIAARRLRSPISPRRFLLWAERWWQLNAYFRVRLFRSAERAGGQNVISFRRYPAKKKRTICFGGAV